MAQQLYFSEHEGTVSTTARVVEANKAPTIRCVTFRVDEHKVGTPDVPGADLLSVSGVTTTPQTCDACAPRPKRD
jgi:hypothetical protein